MADEAMERDRFLHLRSLFDGIVDLPAAEREVALRDLQVTAEQRQILQHLVGLHDRLGQSTARAALNALSRRSSHDAAGKRAGTFVLERALGHGGMGSVYLAHRADGSVEQKAAVKVIRAELLDENTLARFRLERQVLAFLKHPHIAALLDLGETADGLPFAVMEYVEGEPITTFCTKHGLDTAKRLRLFLEVCDAVAYAHRNMVVHRDIKPSNILVTAEGRPKLLDFGIAKPLSNRYGTQDVTETAAAQRFFSPQNAAPEQVRGEPVSVACDVYGLGVLLYELLAEAPPLELSGMAPGEIERTILDVDPPLPSVRRGDKELRGDLDAIVMRALRKRADERYATVEQLSDDVRRYLTNRPVAARKGRLGYRVRKFAARNRVALFAGLAFAALLITSAVVLWRTSLEALRQRDRAQHATNFLVEAFRAADPEKALGEKLTAKQILEQAQRSLQTEPVGDPELRLELLADIAEIDVHLKSYDAALAALGQAFAALGSDPRTNARMSARLYELQALVLTKTEKFDQARTALADAQALDTEGELAAALETDTLELLFMEGATKELQPHIDRAVREIAPRLPADDPARWSLLIEAAKTLVAVGQAKEAAKMLEDLLRDAGRIPARHPVVLAAKSRLVFVYSESNRNDDAEKLLASIRDDIRSVYGEKSTAMADWSNDMASMVDARGEYDRARELYSSALAIYADAYGPESGHVANAYFNLAENATLAQRYDAAETYFRTSIEVALKAYPRSNENVEMFRTAYGLMLNQRGRYGEADTIFKTVQARATLNSEFVEQDVYKAAIVGDAVAEFGMSPTPAHRVECERALAADVSDASPELQQIFGEQQKVAQTLGLSIAAPQASH